jgi:hypothetical protein
MASHECERNHMLQSAIESALHGVEQARRLRADARLDHAADTLSLMLSESDTEPHKEGGCGGGCTCSGS